MLNYLQIDLLLPSVRPKTSASVTLEQFLHSLHSFLLNTPKVTARHPLDASRRLLKRGIAVPYPHPLPSEDTKWTVAYSPPSDINLVGSWATQTAVKGKDGTKFGVDLAVEMPAVSLHYFLHFRSLTYRRTSSKKRIT
jgi:U3 small nucleolar RNA-associated protein 22